MWAREIQGMRKGVEVLSLLFLLLRISDTQKVITAEEEAIQVQAVAGGGADLPCDISPHQHNDSVLLVVWYREDTPIYSWDARGSRGEEGEGDADDLALLVEGVGAEGDGEEGRDGAHWSGAWGGRARWSPLTARLTLRPAAATDRGDYRCRADFRASPTRNTRVNLQVIEAVGTPTITNEGGTPINGRAGPYKEGDTPSLVCASSGGFPPATVRWYRGARLLAAGGAGGARAPLALPPLTRADLLAPLSCHASNSPLLPPATTTVLVDMHLAPVQTEVWVTDGEALSAGREQEVACSAGGGRPPPSLSLWLRGQKLHGEQKDVVEDKVQENESSEVTSSAGSSLLRVLLTANSSLHGQKLTCRADHPLLNSPLESFLILNVLFPPSVNLSLGATLNPHDIEEGDDVYFECHVLANPPPYKLIWEHNGRPLSADPKAGVTMSGGNLVLRGVGREAAGGYSCSASNVEGDARSASVNLQVMFKPVCSSHLRRTYGVGRQERVQLVCEVEAVPAPDSFSWALNNSAQLLTVPPERYSWSGEPARSTLAFAPLSDADYGTALCWASNLVGRQAEPCALALLPAARPHAPADCALANLTSAGLQLACEDGWDGGLPQRFQLEVWERGAEDRLLANVSAAHAAFSVGGLRAGRSLRLLLYAHNSRGRSPSQALDAYTLELAEKRTDENAIVMDKAWVAGVCGGVVVALLLLILCAAAILKLRQRSGYRSNYNVSTNKPKTATRSELQQQSLHDDKNPDVVPLNKGGEHKVIMEEHSERTDGAESLLPRPPPYSRVPPLLAHNLPVARAGREVVTTRAPLPAAQESDV